MSTQAILDRINEIVSTTNTTDFVMHSFANGTLVLTGSFDHCYYHELEIRFHTVSYIGLPIYGLDSPRFSIATVAERKAHAHLELEETDVLFKIHGAPDFQGGYEHFVAAQRIEISEGTVFYYPREDLKPGERVADWVKRD